jgi:hypothetical protein
MQLLGSPWPQLSHIFLCSEENKERLKKKGWKWFLVWLGCMLLEVRQYKVLQLLAHQIVQLISAKFVGVVTASEMEARLASGWCSFLKELSGLLKMLRPVIACTWLKALMHSMQCTTDLAPAMHD